MSRRTKILLAVFALGIIAIVVQKWLQSRSPGTIVLFAPPDSAVTVTLDGTTYTLGPGQFTRVRATSGSHDVRVLGGPSRTVRIASGLDTIGVPTAAVQCFAEFDVTLSHYQGGGNVQPTIARRVLEDAPFQVPTTEALTESELPTHRTETVRSDGTISHIGLIFLFRTVPCMPGDAHGML
jgi:hypothetical protein